MDINNMLSYKMIGHGKPLLLIHGFGISFEIWKNIIPHLKDKYKLIVIELPGIGKSKLDIHENNYYNYSADEIEKLRKKLKIVNWGVVSYSIGTRVAETYIHKYKKHVFKSVFIFPVYVEKSKAKTLGKLIQIDKEHPIFGNWVLSEWRLNVLIRAIGFNGHSNGEIKNWYNSISSQPISTLKMTLGDMPSFGESKFEITDVPTLFIWGIYDLVSKRPAINTRDVFVGSSHSGIITHAREISEAINYFIE